MLNRGRVVLVCCLLALAATAGGCQREPAWNLAPVEGTVTKDGRPLAKLKVVFLVDSEAGMAGPRSTGFTDEAGHYRLRTDNGDDGVAVGKFRVVLFDLKDQDVPKGRDASGTQQKERIPLSPHLANPLKKAVSSRLPPSYGRFQETPLRVEVRPGAQVIDLDVK